jgi:hypothetical protein
MSRRSTHSHAGRTESTYPRSFVSEPEPGPYLETFTFRLPVVLGVADNFDHDLSVPGDYVDQGNEKVFGSPPFVRVRIFNAEIADRKFAPANLSTATKRFYGQATKAGKAGGNHLYGQWATLETPAVFLSQEHQWDPGPAFHRCVAASNVFLEALALAREKDWVRPISTRELRPIVIIGKLELDATWTEKAPMLMHPDAKESPLTSRPAGQHVDELNRALESITIEVPFVRARHWRARAERRRYEGDSANSVRTAGGAGCKGLVSPCRRQAAGLGERAYRARRPRHAIEC